MVPRDVVVVSGAIRTTLLARLARLPNAHVILMHERDSAARRSVRLTLSTGTAIVTVGSLAARTYERALPKAKVWKANNFLDEHSFERLVAVRGQHSGSREPGRPSLGVLGRLIPEKGVHLLLEELVQHPDAWSQLVVAGSFQDRDYVDTLDRQIVRSGLADRISMMPYTDDVPGLLSGLDVLVIPSVGLEAQPTVILEGLAAGLPVILRAQLFSEDFRDLPVIPYANGDQLVGALARLPLGAAPVALLAERFGADQFFDVLASAATYASRST